MFGGEIEPEDLAVALCGLRYDSLAEYLEAISLKLSSDSRSDGDGGRYQLEDRLDSASIGIARAAREIRQAWKICESHMEKEEE